MTRECTAHSAHSEGSWSLSVAVDMQEHDVLHDRHAMLSMQMEESNTEVNAIKYHFNVL